MVYAQQDDARDQQQFVGQGVEDSSQLAALVITTRNVTVHSIADCGDRKGKNRKQPMDLVSGPDVVQNLHHEKRNQQDPKDRDFVRGGHSLAGVLAEVAKSQSCGAIWRFFGWTESVT
jgi:hypothetical protein